MRQRIERSTINRPQGINVDLHDRPKEQWIRVVCIDETPTASRGRRENCAQSIKNSIRNYVCSRTHTITSSCVTSIPHRWPADFPPSAAPRESRNYGDPSPFTLPPAGPEATQGWSPFSLLVSPYIYTRPSLIADCLFSSLFLSPPSLFLFFDLSLVCVRLLVIT